MKTIAKRLILTAVALTGIGYAGRAQAQTQNVQYILILLDQTGSMATISNSVAGTTFWDDAVSGAQAWVTQDGPNFNGTTLPQRAYAVWNFFDTKCCGQTGNQNGAVQIWPALNSDGSTSSTDCGPGTNSTFEKSTGFCIFGANDPATPYFALLSRLGDFGNSDPTSIRNANRAITNVGNTPLADSLCQTMEKLQLSVAAQNRILLLETDAGENDSVNPCASPNGFVNIPSGATAFNKNDVDWDLSGAAPGVTPDPVNNPSWEAKVMRRAVRLAGNPPTTIPPDIASETAAEALGPIKPGQDLPPLMSMRVDLHFMICNPGDPAPCPVTTAWSPILKGINLPGLGVIPLALTEAKAATPALATPKFAVTQAMTAPLTTTGQTTITAPGVPLIDTNEFEFFQALGHVNSKSTFRAITSDSSVHFGTSHKLVGDVDDSGCVDHADFAEVTQKDIYHQRAVLPLELATRADLNHDGWVTKADAAIVIANWGHGCINGAGTPPALPKF
ncbi:MAG TPA: dockerin type I domain-containing protein [Polyangia bacterium]|nr:dockerin type I domain-containing protein [Polyangia bacterium]